ncbi:MAG: hypothetical protein ACFFB3_13895 [Candidatus Hodarchaeota archaeon]
MATAHNYNNIRLVEEECIQFGTEDTPGTLFVGFAGPGKIGPIAVDMLFRFLTC